MTGIEAIGAVAVTSAGAALPAAGIAHLHPQQAGGANFADLLAGGLRHMEEKVATANNLVRSFALDDSVPLHQVTYALEEARLSVELAMQVRSRLVESYRELMNMQI